MLGVARPRLRGRGPLKVGVVAKNLRALCAQLYLQPHHIKIPRSAPAYGYGSLYYNVLRL
jgi:hypothetical protein